MYPFTAAIINRNIMPYLRLSSAHVSIIFQLQGIKALGRNGISNISILCVFIHSLNVLTTFQLGAQNGPEMLIWANNHYYTHCPTVGDPGKNSHCPPPWWWRGQKCNFGLITLDPSIIFFWRHWIFTMENCGCADNQAIAHECI